MTPVFPQDRWTFVATLAGKARCRCRIYAGLALLCAAVIFVLGTWLWRALTTALASPDGIGALPLAAEGALVGAATLVLALLGLLCVAVTRFADSRVVHAHARRLQLLQQQGAEPEAIEPVLAALYHSPIRPPMTIRQERRVWPGLAGRDYLVVAALAVGCIYLTGLVHFLLRVVGLWPDVERFLRRVF